MIKKRIKQNELASIILLDDKQYAFAFIFKTYPFYRPIKRKSVDKYKDILEAYNVKP